MTKLLSLPVGIENFEKLRENSYYYVDKTRLIELLLEQQNEITLFTRPRRFGKSLNMSMLFSSPERTKLPSSKLISAKIVLSVKNIWENSL